MLLAWAVHMGAGTARVTVQEAVRVTDTLTVQEVDMAFDTAKATPKVAVNRKERKDEQRRKW
jgi:hypothetical protein